MADDFQGRANHRARKRHVSRRAGTQPEQERAGLGTMITFLPLERFNNLRVDAANQPESAPGAVQHENSILDEESFLRTLTFERKRTERSGNPFGLVLIDVVDLAVENKGSIKIVESILLEAVRDIDVAGWYSSGSCLGLICAGVEGSDLANGGQRIIGNLEAKLVMALGAALAAKINISALLFPAESGVLTENQNMHFYPDVHVIERARRGALFVKRVMDIVGSLAALMMLSPVFLTIALIIKFTSRGPILFKQTRIGRYGKPFTFLKFRSMYANNDPKIHQEYVAKLIAGGGELKNEDGSPAVFKIKNDPRVTRIGHFLRRSSLDELPQFVNVLLGQMSLVGPRPPVPYEYAQYNLWHRRRSLEVKPGITGLWQVSGRSRTNFDEMVRLDLQYASNWTIWWDIKILLNTPKAVFSCDGAY